jgi:hypothetical protein
MRSKAVERVHKTFLQWKRHKIPDRTAFYHTALDIRYRRGGLPERLALLQLRYQRSVWRGKMIRFRSQISQVFKFAIWLRP